MWKKAMELEWAEYRYRYPLRFILHFACAVFAEIVIMEERKVAKQISRTNLGDRLRMDLALCFGDKTARSFSDLLKLVPEIIATDGGLEYHGLNSLVYSSEGFIENLPVDASWRPPRLEPKFDRRLSSAFIHYIREMNGIDMNSHRMWI